MNKRWTQIGWLHQKPADLQLLWTLKPYAPSGLLAEYSIVVGVGDLDWVTEMFVNP